MMDKQHLSRRAALVGTAAIGAMMLPAGAAVAAGLPAIGTDPLIAMWRERQAIVAEMDGRKFDDAEDLYKRQWDLEEKIAETAPVSPEGLAIVSTVLLVWYDEFHDSTDDCGEIDQRAGATMARHILAATPPDVLHRAGLELPAA